MARIAEVGKETYQVTTYLAEMDFSINQYLVLGDEPLLFHTGMHGIFEDVRAAVAEVIDPASLRWITFGHTEADECGAMNDWLATAPNATVAFGATGCMLSIGDLATRPPRALGNGEVLDIGGHRMRWIDTPHVPHNIDAGLLYDEDARNLFCGDLFALYGNWSPTTTDDIVAPAIAAEDAWPSMSLHPATGEIIRGLAALEIEALALMHGPVFIGDCAAALVALASDADRRISDHNPTI
jgi:flavorubredoxin